MKLARIVTLVVVSIVLCGVAQAQMITVTMQDGQQLEVPYAKRTINKSYVKLESGDRIDYADIKKISTDYFVAYEKAMQRTARKSAKHVEIEFTGDANLFAKRMEKLQQQRNAAHAARGAGGILMLLGALTGDRDVAALGAVAYGAGTIARDINTEKTLDAQTAAIVEMQEKEAQREADADLVRLEEDLRDMYGNENVDGLIALIDKNYRRATALALAGETSPNPTHQAGAAWLLAMTYADQKDSAGLAQALEKVVELDPETEDTEDAGEWLKTLMLDLEELRKANSAS